MNICEGCEHLSSKHYYDIDGVIRCVVVINTVSTSGVIGLRGTYECDCINKVSKNMDQEREQKKRKDEEWAKHIDLIVKNINIKINDK